MGRGLNIPFDLAPSDEGQGREACSMWELYNRGRHYQAITAGWMSAIPKGEEYRVRIRTDLWSRHQGVTFLTLGIGLRKADGLGQHARKRGGRCSLHEKPCCKFVAERSSSWQVSTVCTPLPCRMQYSTHFTKSLYNPGPKLDVQADISSSLHLLTFQFVAGLCDPTEASNCPFLSTTSQSILSHQCPKNCFLPAKPKSLSHTCCHVLTHIMISILAPPGADFSPLPLLAPKLPACRLVLVSLSCAL